MRTRKRGSALLLIIALVLCPLAAPPALAQVPQETIEAAYLAKFGRYVAWPPSRMAGREMQLCLVGKDPFGRKIDRVAGGETIGGRSISVRRVSSARGAAGCHIAFVQGAGEDETRSLLNSMDNLSVLTVTSDRAGSARGMIHFVVRDGRVRFYIDDAEASRRGLAISSRLLALAIAVKRQGS